MKLLKALFSDSNSVSMMRVMSLICCITAVCLAILGIMKTNVDYSGVALLCTTFLTAAFSGKIIQKRIEVDGAKSDTSTEIDK